MSALHLWAQRHGVSAEALTDLQQSLGIGAPPPTPAEVRIIKSEAWVQNTVRMEASQRGMRLFRNNVGALKDEQGRVVRFGLGNDSPTLNAVLKSADLIGIRPLLIGPHHVGTLVGQFVSREIKATDWRYTGSGREAAQLAWANLVNSLGGDAAFATGEGTL